MPTRLGHVIKDVTIVLDRLNGNGSGTNKLHAPPKRGKSTLTDSERMSILSLLPLLPLRSKEWMLLPVVFNMLSLRFGGDPVGPDFDVSDEWLREAVLTMISERPPLLDTQQS